jgi:hypothetical protein
VCGERERERERERGREGENLEVLLPRSIQKLLEFPLRMLNFMCLYR